MTLEELQAKKKEIETAIKVLEIGGEYAVNGRVKYELNPHSDYPCQVSASSACMRRYHKKGAYIEYVGEKWFPFIRCKSRTEAITTIEIIIQDLQQLKTNISNLPKPQEGK